MTISENLFGKLFGDKGYLSQSQFETLFERGMELATTVRKTMQGQLMMLSDRLLLCKRFIIETITDQLKNVSQIEHTRHLSPTNFAVNLLAGLVSPGQEAFITVVSRSNATTRSDLLPELRLI